MTPIQPILIVLILAIGATYVVALSSRLVSRLIGVALAGLGVLCVLEPGLTTWMALRVGVGRGADLLSYCAMLSGVYFGLLLYRKHRALERTLTEVARQVALAGARAPYGR